MNLPKYLLAGSGEKAQYLVHNFNDNTIRFVLHYPGKIKAATLCEATRALADSVDILHATFHAGSINAYWQVNRTYDTKDYFAYIETEENSMELAITASLLPIRPEGAVQLHCTLVQGKEDAAIVLRLSHLCVDGSDGKYLLYKLMEAYNMIYNTGKAEALSVKNGNRAAEQVYKELSAEDMKSLMKNPLSSVKMSFPFATEEDGELCMVRSCIPADLLSKARKKAKEEGATVNDLLLAAYYRAYASLEGVDASAPMSIMSMMDLRHHCKNGETDGLTNVSGSLPTSLMEGVSGAFEETLRQIVVQTKAAKENPLSGMEGMPLLHGATHLPMGLLFHVVGRLYGSMSIGLTNLGQIDCKALTLGELTPDTGVCCGPLKKKPSMQICVASFQGTATLSIGGEYTKEDAKVLEQLLKNIVDEVAGYGEETTQ